MNVGKVWEAGKKRENPDVKEEIGVWV